MDIEADAIIISDSYDKFGLSDQRRISNERVQDFLNHGLMTQAAVYERFTEALSEDLINLPHGSEEVSSIRQAYRQLRNSDTASISKERFESVIKEEVSGQVLVDSTGLSALFDILVWHAAFPFPPIRTALGIPLIDEDAFLRAICLLTGDTTSRYAPTFSTPVHGLYSGNWGPYKGWVVVTRGKDARDWRRRLFRSLAEPAESREAAEKPTTVAAPRFAMYQRREGDLQKSDEEEPDQQVVVMADEDERSIDLQDVLSEHPPEVDRITTNPLRESYALALDALPRQPHDLAELSVPKAKLVSFLRLLHVSEGEADEGEVAEAYALGDEPSHIGWQRFDAALSSQTEQIANMLSNIFSVFKAPLSSDCA
ncbi:hypothetical protein MFIFM68171_01136 [Madurella fahalii]|uniref:Uncharacterized protein n=1 Tax=Madurella fahalii TaxID=1157608 RepID=A0ABQ0FZJ5_9PEZI